MLQNGGVTMDELRPSYYAVIPADVRYDDEIPPNAKLLYGEISALIGKDGFCFASNTYFMNLYGFSDPTVSRLLKQLEDNGYIIREQERDSSGKVVRRKIYLNVSAPEEQPPLKINTPKSQNREGGGIKNEGYTNTSNTDNIPPNPPEGDRPQGKKSGRGRQTKAQADVLPDRFEGFWTFYREHMPPDRNAGSRQKAIRAWDNLAPTGELVTEIAKSLARQVRSQAWISGIGVPHASTWLNNRGWEDDWGAPPPAEGSPGEGRSEEWLN